MMRCYLIDYDLHVRGLHYNCSQQDNDFQFSGVPTWVGKAHSLLTQTSVVGEVNTAPVISEGEEQ